MHDICLRAFKWGCRILPQMFPLQAEAHADHLSDALDVQKREMSRVHLRELDEMLEGATLSHRRELAAIMGHVRGLQVCVC